MAYFSSLNFSKVLTYLNLRILKIPLINPCIHLVLCTNYRHRWVAQLVRSWLACFHYSILGPDESMILGVKFRICFWVERILTHSQVFVEGGLTKIYKNQCFRTENYLKRISKKQVEIQERNNDALPFHTRSSLDSSRSSSCTNQTPLKLFFITWCCQENYGPCSQ